VGDATLKLYVCWTFLVAGLAVLLVSVVAGFARDIELDRADGARR